MDEFRAMAKQLTDSAKGQYGVSLADNATIAMWPILIWADGGDIVGADGCSALADPATIAAVQSWSDLVSKDGVSPAGLTGADSDNLVAAGKAALQMNGPWAAGTYTEAGLDFDVAPIPTGSAGQVTLASSVPGAGPSQSKTATHRSPPGWRIGCSTESDPDPRRAVAPTTAANDGPVRCGRSGSFCNHATQIRLPTRFDAGRHATEEKPRHQRLAFPNVELHRGRCITDWRPPPYPDGDRGYVRLDFDRRDPWEAIEAAAGHEHEAREANRRVR